MRNIKYTKEILEPLVAESFSATEVMVKLKGTCGGSLTHVCRLMKKYELDTSHFTGQSMRIKKLKERRRSPESILVNRPDGYSRADSGQLRRALIESGIPAICKICGLSSEWNGKLLRLQVDHIDGNWLDDRIDNLRFLCPNCHSQTETYGCRSKCERKPKIKKQRGKLSPCPTKEELEKLLWSMPTKEIAKNFGVGHRCVDKWAKQYGLVKPKRNYWAKQ